MAVVTSIMRAQQIIQVRVDEMLAPFGLTFARFELLRLLAFSRAGALPLGKAGARLQVHQTSITNVVTRLDERGLVTVKPDVNDRRVTRVSLSRSGTSRLRKANQLLAEVDFGVGELDKSELETISALLFRVRAEHGDAAR